jgi:hypothetical protein
MVHVFKNFANIQFIIQISVFQTTISVHYRMCDATVPSEMRFAQDFPDGFHSGSGGCPMFHKLFLSGH